MLNFINVLTDVAPISPGIWATIQENYAIVATAISGAVASLMGVIVVIKSSLAKGTALLAKKKEDGDTTKNVLIAKFETNKALMMRKGQLEVNKKACEAEIMNATIKLDVITKPETRELVENRIAQEKAELAGHVKELDAINSKLSPITDLFRV